MRCDQRDEIAQHHRGIASPATIGCQTAVAEGKPSSSTRTNAAKAAVFTPVAMKPVIGVGAPS